MTSTSSRGAGLLGAQRPRVEWIPPASSSAGQEAIELARMAGLNLDPWQEYVLMHALAERRDGQWAAKEVACVVPRQNGKGALLEAMELAGLFLLGERLIIHSAHQFDTSYEGFIRLKQRIEANDEFSRRVSAVRKSHGEEGIELVNGQRIRFRTRTKGGGRGFSCDRLILDEAMILPLPAHGALFFTVSARENSQIVYTGSAVDQNVHEHGLVLTRLRNRGQRGANGLAYFEWSADGEIGQVDIADRELWTRANPALGIRIEEEHVAVEEQAMDPRTFCVERLGIGDWPNLDAVDSDGITLDAWLAVEDVGSRSQDPVCLSFDVRPDRSAAAVCAAGVRVDGLSHVEVLEHRAGVGWVPGMLKDLCERNDVSSVVFCENSPAATLKKRCEELDVNLRPITGPEYAQACGGMFDAVEDRTVRHIGTQELQDAIRGAVKRSLGDSWAWSRKSSTVDISPLVGCTIALWGVGNAAPSVYEGRGVLVV